MTYHLYGQDMDLTHHISCNYQQAAAYLEWWMSMELWLHSAPQIQWLPTTIHHFQGFFNISTWWYMSLVCRNGALAMYYASIVYISRGVHHLRQLVRFSVDLLFWWDEKNCKAGDCLGFLTEMTIVSANWFSILDALNIYVSTSDRSIYTHPTSGYLALKNESRKMRPKCLRWGIELCHRSTPEKNARKLIQKRKWKR